MKHLEFFNYKNIFLGFCCGPDSVNFFFSIVSFVRFFLLPFPTKLVLMYPSLVSQ